MTIPTTSPPTTDLLGERVRCYNGSGTREGIVRAVFVHHEIHVGSPLLGLVIMLDSGQLYTHYTGTMTVVESSE